MPAMNGSVAIEVSESTTHPACIASLRRSHSKYGSAEVCRLSSNHALASRARLSSPLTNEADPAWLGAALSEITSRLS